MKCALSTSNKINVKIVILNNFIKYCNFNIISIYISRADKINN